MTSNHHSELRSRIHGLRQELANLRRELHTGGVVDGQDAFDVLVCAVGTRNVGIPKAEVERVVWAAALAELPGASEWVAGVLNYAGDLLPVADLMTWLDGRPHDMKPSDAIVICNIDRRRCGLIVEEVVDVETVCGGVMRHVTSDVAELPFVLGVAPRDDGSLLILSAEAVIDHLETSIA